MKDILKPYAANENNKNWDKIIKREKELYKRNNDIRSEFERDYTRIIHSTAYRRMKHKTQVFFSPPNDHICTRIEHVTHVESISYTIAKYLGLNTELTRAIAIAHDIGHSPFGHEGEKILSKISQRDIGERFWHEKNGLERVDKVELLESPDGDVKTMNLTYAVRDGIISHCGEIDENKLKPREEYINLEEYKYPNQYAPFTWEACVVKIADKISYLGRDIADAIELGILEKDLKELYTILNYDITKKLNNTTIINDLIYDLCMNSNPEDGLCFSEETFKLINKLKEFNYQKIYSSEKVLQSINYFELIINTIYDVLKGYFVDKDKPKLLYPSLINDFEKWLQGYWKTIDNTDETEQSKAIIYYISGMTDNYAIKIYEKIIGF